MCNLRISVHNGDDGGSSHGVNDIRAELDYARNDQNQVALVLFQVERYADDHQVVVVVRQREVDLVQRQAVLLLVGLAVEDIDSLVAQQDKAVAGLVAVPIELGAEGLVLKLLAAEGAGHEVVDSLDVFLGDAVLLEPSGHTARVVVLLALKDLLRQDLQLELPLLLRRRFKAVDLAK